MFKYKTKYLLFTVIFLLLYWAVSLSSDINKAKVITNYENWASAFQDKVIMQEQAFLNFKDEKLNQLDYNKLNEFKTAPYKLFIYSNDSLIYYNDQLIIPPNPFEIESDKFYSWFQKNGIYHMYKTWNKGYTILSFIPVQSFYPIKNKYLKPVLSEMYNPGGNFELELDDSRKGYIIYNNNGEFLFSIKRFSFLNETSWHDYVLLIFGILFTLSLGFSIHYYLSYLIIKLKRSWIILIAFVALVFSMRMLSISFGFPGILYEFELFKPQYFASSIFWPSLGDTLFNIIIILWVVSELFTHSKKLTISKSLKWYFLITGSIVIYALLEWYGYFVESLILNSNIEININNLFSFNFTNGVFLIILGSLIFLLYIIYDWVENKICDEKFTIVQYTAVSLIFVLFWSTVSYFIKDTGYENVQSFVLYAHVFPAIGGFILLFNTRYLNRFSFINRAFYFISFFSVFFSLVILSAKEIKKEEKKNRVISKLAEDRNPLMEFKIQNLIDEIKNKDSLCRSLQMGEINKEQFLQHLNYKYDYDELAQYSFSYLEFPEDIYYLDNMDTISKGSNTIYWIRDNMFNSTYVFSISGINNPIKHYFKLVSDLKNYDRLTPDCLRHGKSLDIIDQFKLYNHAFYFNGVLVNSFGEYLFQNNLKDTYSIKVGTKQYLIDEDNVQRLIYRPTEQHIIMLVSRPIGKNDFISIFSYLFSFFFLQAVLLFIILKSLEYLLRLFPFGIRLPVFRLYLRNKIHLLTLLVLMISFVLVGTNTMYNVNKEFGKYHEKRMSRKVRAIMSHLNYLKYDLPDDVFEEIWHKTVQKLSIINKIGLNLFDNKGTLVYSSQPEIYEREFISNRIPLSILNKVSKDISGDKFIAHEKVGSFEYYTVYFPLFSDEMELVGVVNIPYYTSIEDMESEVTSLLLNLNNLYVVLFFVISLFISLFSYRVSHSLSMISIRLKEFKLGKKNEPIEWDSNDEIGELIKEYNKMLNELEKSANKLAQSERETAWREMAKQVAHEIKNPLTPMKLSVQHLNRAIKENRADIEELVNRVSKTLVEQIDHLSFIATEFSSFAKMPKAKNEVLDIYNESKAIVDLFEKEASLEFIYEEGISLYVYMDKSQLVRVITNIIKNAVQAIEEVEKGKVIISLETYENKIRLKFNDNGIGISEDLGDKVFEPNFTTKSSGTGLGLAMCKSIIENSNGNIWYESGKEGTSFYLELPKYDKK